MLSTNLILKFLYPNMREYDNYQCFNFGCDCIHLLLLPLGKTWIHVFLYFVFLRNILTKKSQLWYSIMVYKEDGSGVIHLSKLLFHNYLNVQILVTVAVAAKTKISHFLLENSSKFGMVQFLPLLIQNAVCFW